MPAYWNATADVDKWTGTAAAAVVVMVVMMGALPD
jgi:hypothetical protein